MIAIWLMIISAVFFVVFIGVLFACGARLSTPQLPSSIDAAWKRNPEDK